MSPLRKLASVTFTSRKRPIPPSANLWLSAVKRTGGGDAQKRFDPFSSTAPQSGRDMRRTDVRAVGSWQQRRWTGGSVMLGSRWPGTVASDTVDSLLFSRSLELPAEEVKKNCGPWHRFRQMWV